MPQTEQFTLTVPFNAPDGEFEIRAGVEDLSLEDGSNDAVIGKVTIGNGVAEEVVPVKAEFTSFNIPDSIKKDEPFNVSANFSLNREIGREAKPYIVFWKDGLLYEVLTGRDAIDEKSGGFEFSATLTSDLPAGSYEVKPGIH